MRESAVELTTALRTAVDGDTLGARGHSNVVGAEGDSLSYKDQMGIHPSTTG